MFFGLIFTYLCIWYIVTLIEMLLSKLKCFEMSFRISDSLCVVETKVPHDVILSSYML